MSIPGSLAALGAAACWAGTALCFARAGRSVGSEAVNVWRLLIALGLLTAAVVVVGSPLPTRIEQWGWLAMSGAIGLALGDACYFQSLVLLGARRAALVMAFNPVPGALLDYLVFGQTLGALTILGGALTLGGISWVIAERVTVSETVPPVSWAGIACASCGALCQAVGLVLSKLAMHPMREELAMTAADPQVLSMSIALSVTHIRLAVAAVVMVTWMLARRELRVSTARVARDPRVMAIIALGAFLGPVAGVWFSQLSILYVPVGVAATLMSTSPVMVIPLVMIFEREQVSARALLGAVVTVTGVAMLAL